MVSLLAILCSRALAQDPEVFEQIYLKTYLETSRTDLNKALKIADSLYEHAEAATFKVRSLMLSATLYQQTGDLTNALVFAEKAQGIAQQTEDYNWQARVAGFLAGQYRWVRLYEKSNEYAGKAMAAAKKISNPEIANSTIGLMYQEQAYSAIAKKKYRKAIEDVRNAQKHFNNTSKKNIDFLTANNEQLAGDAYVGLKLYDSALNHYNNGLKHLEKLPENYVGGLILNGLSQIYMDLGDMTTARRWLDSAESIADRSHYQQLKVVVYETVKRYARMVADVDQLSEAQKVLDTARTIITVKKDSFLNHTLSGLEQNYREEATQSSYKNILILAALIIIAGTLFFTGISRKQQKAKFRAVLAGISEREEQRQRQQVAAVLPVEVSASLEQSPEVQTPVPEEVPVQGAAPVANGDQSRELTAIPEETVRKILGHLQEFEAGTLFTNRNISLAYLAAHINTNTKYLSRLINQYKQKDFNGYINELRVNYIIGQLKNDPVWRKYKISTLADEGGFSSHSKFAAVFKSVTGIAPSLFIQYLEAELRNGKE